MLAPEWREPGPSGIAIGVFDGVHLGHAGLVRSLISQCRPLGIQCGIVTFDPHPVEVLNPVRAPLLLTTLERRRELFMDLGVDWVGVLDLAEIRTMTPEEFVTGILVGRGAARLVSVGADFRFGIDRSGDVKTLRQQGARRGFAVEPVELVEDATGPISSSRIRQLIAEGDVGGAGVLLGRAHRLSGPVIRGDARGRLLGYPTANLAPPARMAVPADGIYAVRVKGAVKADGVCSIGVRPTFTDGGGRLIEVHLFDFDGDLYGDELDIDFIARLRDEERFDTVDALIEQMDRDSSRARAILAAG